MAGIRENESVESKRGRLSHRKGADAEREMAKLIQSSFPGHNVQRIGGNERRKNVLVGDIVCLMYDRWGLKVCKHAPECFFQGLFFDVKKRITRAVPTWWRKINDDCPVNRIPVLIYYHPQTKWMVRWKGEGAYLLKDWLQIIRAEYGQP